MRRYIRILISVAVITSLALLGFVFIQNLIDFPVYYASGRSLLSGRTDLYAPDFARGRLMDYRYPPLFLLIFYPLWLLPYKEAAYIWYLLSILQIAACVFAVRALLGPAHNLKKGWIVAFFAVAQYFVMILHYGNAHLLAISLLFLGLYLYYHRREALAATLIALSITIKLTPILILPYFALKRRWNLLLAVAGLLIALNLSPAAYFGFDGNIKLLDKWFRHVVIDQEFHEVNGPINLSLKGHLRRYLTKVDYSKRAEGDTLYPAVNIVSLEVREADLLWLGAATVIFLSLLILLWRGGVTRERLAAETQNAPGMIRPLRDSADDSGLSVALELGVMVCLMLLVGPLTSKIYFIALIWPVVALAAYGFNKDGSAAALARWVIVIIAVTNSVLPLLPGSSIQRLFLVAGVDFYMNLLLLTAQGYALVSRDQPIQASTDGLRRPALSETTSS